MAVLGLVSAVPKGPHKGKKVSEIIGDKSAVFSLIREGVQFDDDVLSLAKIKKVVGEPQFSFSVGEHIMSDKKYVKDKTPLKSIIKELTTDEDTLGTNIDSNLHTEGGYSPINTEIIEEL